MGVLPPPRQHKNGCAPFHQPTPNQRTDEAKVGRPLAGRQAARGAQLVAVIAAGRLQRVMHDGRDIVPAVRLLVCCVRCFRCVFGGGAFRPEATTTTPATNKNTPPFVTNLAGDEKGPLAELRVAVEKAGQALVQLRGDFQTRARHRAAAAAAVIIIVIILIAAGAAIADADGLVDDQQPKRARPRVGVAARRRAAALADQRRAELVHQSKRRRAARAARGCLFL